MHRQLAGSTGGGRHVVVEERGHAQRERRDQGQRPAGLGVDQRQAAGGRRRALQGDLIEAVRCAALCHAGSSCCTNAINDDQ